MKKNNLTPKGNMILSLMMYYKLNVKKSGMQDMNELYDRIECVVKNLDNIVNNVSINEDTPENGGGNCLQ